MPYSFEGADWRIDVNGFLRITARAAKIGPMRYTRDELADVVPPDAGGDTFELMLEGQTLEDPAALQALEGMPVCAGDHMDMAPGEMTAQVGSVAGVPRMNGPYLECDLVITHPDTIDQIKQRQLTELSPQYIADIIWETGDYQGRPFDGRQVNLRYSHIALLPPGDARGGSDVRVLNSKPTEGKAMDVTAVQLSNGKTVRVVNDDLLTLTSHNAELSNQATEAASDMGKLQETMAELTALKEERATMTGRIEELQGQLAEMKQQLDEAMAPENAEMMANQMAEERDEAEKIMTNAGVDDEQRMENGLPDELKKLHGLALKSEVINRVRLANKRDPITEEQAKSEGFVNGVWSTMLENSKSDKPAVSGSTMVQNSAGLKLVAENPNQDRFNKLYGGGK